MFSQNKRPDKLIKLDPTILVWVVIFVWDIKSLIVEGRRVIL